MRKRRINTRFNEMRRKEEGSKQGEINNKVRQHSTPHVRLEAMHEYYTLLHSHKLASIHVNMNIHTHTHTHTHTRTESLT